MAWDEHGTDDESSDSEESLAWPAPRSPLVRRHRLSPKKATLGQGLLLSTRSGCSYTEEHRMTALALTF